MTITLQGDFGKPRPALVVQSDRFRSHPTLTVLLVSSALVKAPFLRVTVESDESNHLRAPSQIMVDKAMTVLRDKVGSPFGRLEANQMREVDRRLALFFGLAK